MKSLKGPFLFNLTADPTEDHDICQLFKERCDGMFASMKKFRDSIDYSQAYESECAEKGPPSPAPTPVPAGGFSLTTGSGQCLTVHSLEKHGVVSVDECDEGSHWDDAEGYLTNLGADPSVFCLKLDGVDSKPCSQGNTLWLGACKKTDPGFYVNENGNLVTETCPGMCAVPTSNEKVSYYTSRAVGLGSCTSDEPFQFARSRSSLMTI